MVTRPESLIVIWLYLVGAVLSYLHLRSNDDERTPLSLLADAALSVLWPGTLLLGVIIAASTGRTTK